MLWQTETPFPSDSPEVQPAPPGDKAPENDPYDRLLDSRMVDEGCPNSREDE